MAGRRQLRVAVAMTLLSSTGLSARDVGAQSNEELMAIIREQQRQIDELSRKVDALTGQTQAAEDKAETATETAQKVEEEAPDIKVKWGPGATISSKDGNWSVHVFGRLQVDGGALGDDDDSTRTTMPPSCAPRASASRATYTTGSTSWSPTSA
jgi:outer membrane murein-binding lipoprotein Lpp